MGDGYENGEPHWQIREDGKMMLSVMVDDSRPHPKWPRSESRFHHVYFSPPMWDLSMSGQWLHLASVFDSENRAVSPLCERKKEFHGKPIEEMCFSSTNSELETEKSETGGQPFREDPNFAIRNLNGRMDELAIFQTALTDREIEELYQRSRSDQD